MMLARMSKEINLIVDDDNAFINAQTNAGLSFGGEELDSNYREGVRIRAVTVSKSRANEGFQFSYA